MIQLRMDVGLKQSGDNGGAKWLNEGYLECRAQGFEDRLETGCESKLESEITKATPDGSLPLPL